MALPVSVIDDIHDLCHLVIDTPKLRDGIYLAAARRLRSKIEEAARLKQDLVLDDVDIGIVVNLTEIVALAVVNGAKVNASTVMMRICERVIVPITDALGYREAGEAPNVG